MVAFDDFIVVRQLSDNFSEFFGIFVIFLDFHLRILFLLFLELCCFTCVDVLFEVFLNFLKGLIYQFAFIFGKDLVILGKLCWGYFIADNFDALALTFDII